MERLPLPKIIVSCERNSNRMHIWVIFQKWSFAWDIESAMVTMKEHVAMKDLWTGMPGWEDSHEAKYNLPGKVVKRHVLCGHGRKSCSCWGRSSLKTSSEPSRPSLIPCTMHSSSPDGLDVYIPFSYHVSAAFLPICILFSLHSALAKLVGAKLPQWAVCLPALHLSSGCQLQFWS